MSDHSGNSGTNMQLRAGLDPIDCRSSSEVNFKYNNSLLSLDQFFRNMCSQTAKVKYRLSKAKNIEIYSVV